MVRSTLCFYGGLVAVAAVATVCLGYGLDLTSLPPEALPQIAGADQAPTPTPVLEPPKHFILNPDLGRPPGYPVEISVKELEDFLKTQRRTCLGCGIMSWERATCGMASHGYDPAMTPWLNDPVALDAAYAETKTGTFLARLTLGRNAYRRADRTCDKLTWEKNYEPEYEEQRILRVLYGKDSAKRKELLTEIKDSLQGLDVHQFPTKARESLSVQLEACENDQNPVVVKLAKELRTLVQP